jgi:hypothetical protein
MPSTTSTSARKDTARSFVAQVSRKTTPQEPTKTHAQQERNGKQTVTQKGEKEGYGKGDFTAAEIKRLREDTSPFC